MLESAFKKKHFQQMFFLDDPSFFEDDFQLQQLCPSFLDPSMMPNDLFTEKADVIFEAFCALPAEPEGIPAATFISSVYYKPKHTYIGSSQASGAIHIQTTEEADIPKDNSYLNLALGVKAAFELPAGALDALDQEQTIEGFLFKKAKQNNVDNYHILRQVLEPQSKLSSLELFQRYSFTYEDPEFVATLTAGMRPTQIQKLKPQSSVYRFFTQEVDITPARVSFEECQLLIPKFEVVKITNKQRKKELEIKAILGSSPELTFFTPTEFPIRLKPGESLEVKVGFSAETLGLFEGLMYVLVDEWVFVGSLQAFVVPNAYEIYPFYVTDMLVNQSVELPLFITNPSATDTLIIEELYSTEEDVKLHWPNSKEPVDSENSVVTHIMVPEGQRKLLVNMVFEIDRTLDFYVEIHVRTSLMDILRIPLYYHVHQDVVRFSPPAVDFGLAPLGFDLLKIPLNARARIPEPLVVIEVLLPLADSRLDFQLVDVTRNNVLRRTKDLFLGYVLLDPRKVGPVEQKLLVTLTGQRTNKTYTLEVPIIGSVFETDELPVIKFDISQLTQNLSPRRKLTEPLKLPVSLQAANLVLKNPFNVPIKVKGMINQGNPEFTGFSVGLITIKPGETYTVARVELQTGALRVTSGTKYLALNINNTLMPIAVYVFDRAAVCVWEDQPVNLETVPFCISGHELNFDYVAANDPKTKRLKLTNLNPVPLTIESLQKQQLDELSVVVDRLVDRNGATAPTEEGVLLGPKKTKRQIGLVVPPHHTLLLSFTVLAKESRQKFSRLDFTLKDFANFYINYKYHVVQGSLSMPEEIRFTPTFMGPAQIRSLVARSTFDVPITVKTVTSNDMRLMPHLMPVVLRPHNKTEFGTLSFDPMKLIQDKVQDLPSILAQAFPQLAETFNGFKGLQLTMLQNPKQLPVATVALITPQDLQHFRQRQSEWVAFKGEVATTLTVETNIFSNITIPVRVEQRLPLVTPEAQEGVPETIDFDLVQVGTHQTRSVHIVNPTNEPLTVSLFLATPKAFEQLMAYEQPEVQVQQTANDRDQFFRLYCNGKVDPEAVVDTSELYLSARQDQSVLCAHVHQLLKEAPSASEEFEAFRKRMDAFFKEVYLKQVHLQTQAQLDRKDNIFYFDMAIQNITNRINQQSRARPLEPATLEILKANYQLQQEYLAQAETFVSNLPDMATVLDTSYTILKAVLIGRHATPRFNTTAARPRKEPKAPRSRSYRLRNEILNEVVVLNDTQKLYPDQIVLSDPFIVTYTGQSFFIHPKYQGQTFRVEPRSNLTIKDALVFQPQSLLHPNLEMKLLVKNNHTVLQTVDVRGSGGTGLVEVVAVYKRSSGSDHYVNAQTLSGSIFGLHHYGYPDHIYQMNINESVHNQNVQTVRKRVLAAVYGSGKEPPREIIIRTNYRYSGIPGSGGFSHLQHQAAAEHVENLVPFHVTQDDIFTVVREESEPSFGDFYDFVEDPDQLYINRMLERASHSGNMQEIYTMHARGQMRVRTVHRRVLKLMNTGNLPLAVIAVYFEPGPQGFSIENQKVPFTLQPGQTYLLHLSYVTDFALAKARRKLVFETAQGVIQEYLVDVQLPVHFLQVASDLIPTSNFENYCLFGAKVCLLVAAIGAFSLVGKDVLTHYKFKTLDVPELEERVALFEHTSQQAPPHREILKEYVQSEQVYQLYQQAQDKLGASRQNQMLKEVVNICSNKKPSVCLEAQKQAIDFEKETRRIQHLRIQQYQKEKEQQRQETLPEVKKQHIRVPSQIVQSESLDGIKGGDSSLFSDMSANEANSSHHTEPAQLQEAEAKPKTPVVKVNKKHLQRIKEQQEAEERFRKLELDRKKKEQEEADAAALREAQRLENLRRIEARRLLEQERIKELKKPAPPAESKREDPKSPEPEETPQGESIDLTEKMELDMSGETKQEPISEPQEETILEPKEVPILQGSQGTIENTRRQSEEDKPRRVVIDTSAHYEQQYYYKRTTKPWEHPEPAVYKRKAQQPVEETLSKDDLQPFFESQQRSQEKKETATSIFSYNPLYLNNQSSERTTPNQTPEVFQKMRMQGKQANEVPNFPNPQEKDEEDEEDSEGSEPEQQNNLYNVFKSANSLFSRPLFGTSQPAYNIPAVQEEPKPQYPDQEMEEEQKLFTGSLFGDQSIFEEPPGLKREEHYSAFRRNMQSQQDYHGGGYSNQGYSSQYSSRGSGYYQMPTPPGLGYRPPPSLYSQYQQQQPPPQYGYQPQGYRMYEQHHHHQQQPTWSYQTYQGMQQKRKPYPDNSY